MPKRSQIATREYLKSIPLPTHATSYTVITHETVIANALEQLKLKGFKVTDEKYRANSLGEVAVGVYQLTYGNDPDLGMMFAWANSYDKTMRFKCTVGGFVRASESCIITGDFNWGRKHTGTADSEMIAMVSHQITNGQIYYDNILAVKEQMKKMLLYPVDIATFLGKAFFTKGLFTKEQIGIVRDEMDKPSFLYDENGNSLWSYYNHMLVALKKAHPRTWMDEQRDLHNFVCQEFNLTVQQPSLISQIVQNTPVMTVTTTNHVGPPVVIQAIENSGPVNIYSEQEGEKPVEKMNMEELAEILEDAKPALDKAFTEELVKGKSEFHVTITKPDVPTEEMFSEEAEIMPPNHTLGVPNEAIEIVEKAVEKEINKNLKEIGTNGESYPPTGEDELTKAEQEMIDARIAALNKIPSKKLNLNLPD